MYRPRQPGAGEATVGALLLSHGFAVLVTHGGAVRHCSDRTLRADMGWCRGGQGRPWVSEIAFPRIPCCVASVARSFAHHMTSKPSPDRAGHPDWMRRLSQCDGARFGRPAPTNHREWRVQPGWGPGPLRLPRPLRMSAPLRGLGCALAGGVYRTCVRPFGPAVKRMAAAAE